MPILIRVDELEPGMCLAGNIVNRYSVLLPHGHVLDEKDISSLVRRIPEQVVSITDPLLDQIVDFQDNSHDRNVSRLVRRNVASLVGKVGTQIRTGVHLNGDNIAGMQKVIDEMVTYLRENLVTMAIIEQSGDWDDYLQQHSAGVFYLSLVIGNTIRNYIMDERHRQSSADHIRDSMNLTPLATAALFHDLGMVPLEYLYHKQQPLSDRDKQLLRDHPHSGANMLPEQIEPIVKQTVRDHHENYNGTGYPGALPFEKINIFARIIRIADAYTAAVSDKAYQKAKSSVTVLYEMLHGRYKSFYDPVIMKVFAAVVPPFPIGAKLKLRDGRCAVVVRDNKSDLFLPEIIVAFDELGDPLAQQQLEPPFFLGDHNIELQSYMGDDLSFLNEYIDTTTQKNNEEHAFLFEHSFDELSDFVFP